MSALKPTAPTEILFSILVTFLTPLFLGGATGNYDVPTARAAAIEMLGSFRIRNAWDLFTAVQIVGFGIAALGSHGLSMADDLSAATVLRSRYNANALQRSSERAQVRLDEKQAQEPFAADVDPADEAAVLEAFRQAAEAQEMVSAARARVSGAQPAPRGIDTLHEAPGQDGEHPALAPQPAPLAAVPTSKAAAQSGSPGAMPLAAMSQDERSRIERENQMIWATGMATVATEFAQEMATLPPSERRKHQIRIAALNGAVQQLSNGAAPQIPSLSSFGLPPTRPRTPSS
ncbi:MAG: hypothetical protein ACJ8AI_15325 [Rhodopila sp.]